MNKFDLTDEHISKALLPYGVAADRELCNGIRIYAETLLRWNGKISLTTVTDLDEILRLHFGESFFAASLIPLDDRRVADIGTGAGFPGIPIRMVRPDVDLTLIEPIAKKTAFLCEILRKMGISNATVIRCRMEELPADSGPFDLITSRALGRYEQILRWSKTRISENGTIMLLLGESDAEKISKDESWNWREAIRIPESRSRFVLLGSPSEA